MDTTMRKLAQLDLQFKRKRKLFEEEPNHLKHLFFLHCVKE